MRRLTKAANRTGEGRCDQGSRRPGSPAKPPAGKRGAPGFAAMAGVVSHLRWTEHAWFEVLFLGRPAEGPQVEEEPEDADMRVEGVRLARLLDEYERQCAVSNEIVAAHSLDEVGRHPDFRSATATLWWMLIHMVEETARHVGHLDVVRELLDGETGYC
ncbi:DUF664 domain-containing protein [Nonomuraea sp. NPDC048916]|uniref:mycothiol transferase n=1 Tax=Nonomuraea sp. NPDC048916 TaxID=3154232 RepID=UPI0033E58527